MSHINPLNRKSLNVIGEWIEETDGSQFYNTEAGDFITFKNGQFLLDGEEECRDEIADIIWKSKIGRRVR
ncbi:hypothetical protein FZC76_09925 [Sutcliffiella horikoshii]|uniref:Uncharacterized protein n=1 Tax=Sutcliffiella horikoshii TaxID=79883 RepID=A0A5D4T1S0_9BACI|nr:hypothetical protein [Sutcliffiella horikoshii]TYS68066.1 hypothetical protein FZC76_09925 [Sutcliffiella horikoshii]